MRLEKLEENKMMIEDYLQHNCDTVDLDFQKFYFFSVEYYCIFKNVIFPAEIAMSKFSIKDGVHDTLQYMVNPGSLPKELELSAQLYADENHRRKLPPNIEGETSNKMILNAILNFMDIRVYNRAKNMIYVFVHNEKIDTNYANAAQLTLNQLAMGTIFENRFRVLPAELLLFKLSKYRALMRQKLTESKFKTFLTVDAAKEAMLRDKYIYSTSGCMFHMGINWSHKCCLSKVRRIGYSFAEHCMFSFEKKYPGFHCPADECDNFYDSPSDISIDLA
jgi:piRNA pathway germ-plasm component